MKGITAIIARYLRTTWLIEVPLFLFNLVTNFFFVFIVSKIVQIQQVDIMSMTIFEFLAMGTIVLLFYFPFFVVMSLIKGLALELYMPIVQRMR